MKHVITMLLITVPASLGGQSIASGLRDGPHQGVVNNVRLWYRVAGRAAAGVPPVVFLHGGPGQGSYHFAALVGPYMERSLRMVYFDQRASGNSGRHWTGRNLCLVLEAPSIAAHPALRGAHVSRFDRSRTAG